MMYYRRSEGVKGVESIRGILEKSKRGIEDIKDIL